MACFIAIYVVLNRAIIYHKLFFIASSRLFIRVLILVVLISLWEVRADPGAVYSDPLCRFLKIR